MARPNPQNFNNNPIGDSAAGFMDGLAKALFYGGAVATVIGVGILLYQIFGSGTAGSEAIEQALKYQDYFRMAALWGVLSMSLGAAWLFWGEEVAGPIMLIIGLALAFAQAYMPAALGSGANQLNTNAVNFLSQSGYPAILVGIILIVADVITRARIRMIEGAKAEQMKYGKGMKEERDVRDVFMGKCWQLPYCRKFVRERCPIYHTKRTCWKERVGCMCEESVIKTAMEGKTLSKDMVAAAKFIPQNSKLSAAAKAERCRQCVIYNEHQKHKYKLFLPIIVVGVAAIYIGLRPVLAGVIQGGLQTIDNIYKGVTLQNGKPVDPSVQATSITGGTIPYNEIILFVLTLVAMAYAIKVLEFLVWKLKV